MNKMLDEITRDEYLRRIDDYMPTAWLGHAPFLKFLIRELKPMIFVELGVQHGFSYFVGCQSIQECQLTSRAFAIDHWLGDSQSGFNDECVYQSVVKLNQKYSRFSNLLKMSFDDARDQFKDNSIDLLHIDGFHSYESIKHDFDSWLPKMSNNSIILLHDIYVFRDTFGVHLYWEELRSLYPTIEFVDSNGLGVVFLGEIPKGKLAELVQISKSIEFSKVQATFSSISSDVIQTLPINKVIAERDQAIVELNLVLNSRIWKLFKFYRHIRKRF